MSWRRTEERPRPRTAVWAEERRGPKTAVGAEEWGGPRNVLAEDGGVSGPIRRSEEPQWRLFCVHSHVTRTSLLPPTPGCT